MPKYFTHLASANNPKNALQREAHELLKRASNRLIEHRNEFVLALSDEIDELNAQHPRCTPLDCRSHGIGDGDSIGVTLGAHFTVSFHLYRVKEDK